MKDEVNVKDKKWEFDKNVTECFDDMLSRSIPEYETMRYLVQSIGFQYVQDNTSIIDIGCSNGNAIEPFVKKFGAYNKYLCYDVSEPMLEKCREKFERYIKCGILKAENYDLRQGINRGNTSLVLSILTLQFTPIEYRQKIVQSVYDNLNEGGAFILVEKVLGNNYKLDKMFVERYYDIKAEHQYTEEQIKDKRKSLEGVLVPITAKWNEELLKEAGFKNVDCFWRCLNFCGWIDVK